MSKTHPNWKQTNDNGLVFRSGRAILARIVTEPSDKYRDAPNGKQVARLSVAYQVIPRVGKPAVVMSVTGVAPTIEAAQRIAETVLQETGSIKRPLTAVETDQWVKVGDRLPPPLEQVMVCSYRHDRTRVNTQVLGFAYVGCDNDQWHHVGDRPATMYANQMKPVPLTVTHWKPMPALPEIK